MTSDRPRDAVPIASSDEAPVLAIVVPADAFDAEELRQLATDLEAAGLPVSIEEIPGRRGVFSEILNFVVLSGPQVLVGVLASAAWDGIKSAFGRLHPKEARESFKAHVVLPGGSFDCEAQGPVAEAAAESLEEFMHLHGGHVADAQPPTNANPAHESGSE